MNNWLKAARIFLVLHTLIHVGVGIFAPAAIVGTSRFNPYIYFSVFLLLAPFLTFVIFVALYIKGKSVLRQHVYAREAWDFASFVFAAVLGQIVVSLPAVRYLIVFGNATSLSAESTALYIASNAAGLITSLFVSYWALYLIYAWMFRAYPLRQWHVLYAEYA